MSDRDGGKPTIQIVIFGMGRYWVYHMRYVGGVYLFLGMAGETKKNIGSPANMCGDSKNNH